MICKHEAAYSRWYYEGDQLIKASGYCSDCQTRWMLDKETGKLITTGSEPTEKK
jgi:hypothetical protein